DHRPPLLQVLRRLLRVGQRLRHPLGDLPAAMLVDLKQRAAAGPPGPPCRRPVGRRGVERLLLFLVVVTIAEPAVAQARDPAVLLCDLMGGELLAHHDYLLTPKMAVPIRTIVDPSSTAISKSPVIPIESTCRCGSGSCWNSRASRRKASRVATASASRGPIP